MARKLTGIIIVAIMVMAICGTKAEAKNVCVQGGGSGISMIFFKVKSLKKPGKLTPLHGVSENGDCTIAGTAYTPTNGGDTIFEVIVGCSSETYRYHWVGDATFTGTGLFDRDFDGVSESAATFTGVDCATLPLP